jgi:hypothetical protein
MRPCRNQEQTQAEELLVMYTLADLDRPDGLRSSFPNWKGSATFDWRNGWTRLGGFFADRYFLEQEMREMVHNRFGVKV